MDRNATRPKRQARPIFRLIGIYRYPRLRDLADKGRREQLIVAHHSQISPLPLDRWIVTSATDPSLAHEVTLLTAARLQASCDCEGWELSGACKHVGLVLKEAGLGPWETASPEAERVTGLNLGADWLKAQLEDR